MGRSRFVARLQEDSSEDWDSGCWPAARDGAGAGRVGLVGLEAQ